MSQKNNHPKLTEKVILKILIKSESPLLLSDLSKQLNCNSSQLEQYLTSMAQSGLVIASRRKYREEEKYSSIRVAFVYSASSIAKEYLVDKKRAYLSFVATVIAAVMATLSLIATILIPLLS